LCGRTGRRIRLSLSLSLSHANACNPLLQAHPSALGARQHEGHGFPLLFSPFVSRLALTHLRWDTQRQFTRRSRDPPGSKRRQGGKRYFLTFIYDSTRFCYVYLLKTKDEAFNYFKTYKAKVENQLERKIKRLRSDRGGEYFSNVFDEFCVEHGIIHERTPPFSPQSNGIA
jgi:transposase InsO family protein